MESSERLRPNAGCKQREGGEGCPARGLRPRSGGRGGCTLGGGGLCGVEFASEAAAFSGGSVFVDGAFCRDAVKATGDFAELGLGLGEVAAADGREERFDFVADGGFAAAVSSAGLEVLADAFFGGNRMGHVNYLSSLY